MSLGIVTGTELRDFIDFHCVDMQEIEFTTLDSTCLVEGLDTTGTSQSSVQRAGCSKLVSSCMFGGSRHGTFLTPGLRVDYSAIKRL